ncbi:MAG: hypothetical protein A2Y23_10375 [Clostridiales bacterium GWB2_37_7]|nr:MAG: hypothetical protein A2Y23_10375 [Clostridiales bacterium GWB2_37_7]
MKKQICFLLVMVLMLSAIVVSADGAKGTNAPTMDKLSDSSRIFKVVDGKLVPISKEQFYTERSKVLTERNVHKQEQNDLEITPMSDLVTEYRYEESSYSMYTVFDKYFVAPTFNSSSVDQERSTSNSSTYTGSFNFTITGEIQDDIEAEIGFSFEKSISVTDTVTVTIPPGEWGYAFTVTDIYETRGTIYAKKLLEEWVYKSGAVSKIPIDMYVIIDTSTTKPNYTKGMKVYL